MQPKNPAGAEASAPTLPNTAKHSGPKSGQHSTDDLNLRGLVSVPVLHSFGIFFVFWWVGARFSDEHPFMGKKNTVTFVYFFFFPNNTAVNIVISSTL